MHIYTGDARALDGALVRETAACLAAGREVMVLVPEMATMQTERMLLNALSLEGSFDVQVLSPSRLSERVFERCGQGAAGALTRIDEMGKRMAAAGAFADVKEQLRYYGGTGGRPGFLTHLAALIADLKRAQITPETAAAYGEAQEEGARRDKLTDLALLYGAYEKRIAGQFVDGEDVLEAELGLIAAGFARGKTVLAAGFDMLTGQMSRTLLAVCRGGGEAALMIRCDPEVEAYAPVWESVERLQQLCRETGVPVRFTRLDEGAGAPGGALGHAQRHFLTGRPYPAPVENIRLHAAATPYFEMRFVAREILRLHRGGVPFEEMTVALCAPEEYQSVCESVFRDYGIPVFLPRKMPAATHGAARFFLASLHAAAGGFQPEDMADVLRSGYAPVEDGAAWRLENYMTAYGIRGKMFLAPFTRGTEEERAALEAPRQALTEPLVRLRQAMRQAESNRQLLEGMQTYLEETGVYQRLMAQEEKLLARGLPTQAAQGRQVWGQLMRLMEQMDALFGGDPVSPGGMVQWWEAGLSALSLSALPPDGACVACGQVGGLPGGETRVVFLCGAQDGALSPDGEGLMTDEERDGLQQAAKAYIALDADGKEDLKRLDFYRALCMAQETLYVTRAMANQAGEARRPHLYLTALRRQFPLLVEEGGVQTGTQERMPLSPATAAEETVRRARAGEKPEGVWEQAWRYLCRYEPALARQAEAAFVRRDAAAPLSRETTHRLFLERVMSVSRLETFAVCPYRHFVQYGLRPAPQKTWTVTSQDAGSFYHSALEGFTRLLPSIPNWPKVGKKECDAWMDRASKEILNRQLGEKVQDSARVRAAGERYRRVLRRVAWAFTKGAQQSAFRPQGGEVRFGYPDEGSLPALKMKLRNGQTVLLRGVIDRVDRYEGDEGLYLRVVDYKSGSREMSPAQVFYGAQLQLLLYLASVLDAEPDALPAGAYYYRIQDPLLEEPEDVGEIEEQLAEKMYLKGVTLRDARIIRLMDGAEPPLTLPKMITADGSFARGKPLAGLEDMRRLLFHARDTARELCENMRRGDIDAAPLSDGEENSFCQRCEYAAVCRREEARPRMMDKMSFDELLRRVNEEENGEKTQ